MGVENRVEENRRDVFRIDGRVEFGMDLRGQESGGSIAEVYYWKAKPGKLDDYNRYIKTVAEPVDFDAPGRSFRLPPTFLASRTLLGRICAYSS